MQIHQKLKKITASFLLLVLASETFAPTAAYALTSGPSQPEMQSFEPVGTTDLVNPFSGDFVYNIPLLDVEGYPVNIAYHSGISTEDEASWVGLGWNINPGNISHAVRGIPDDFNGETIEKEVDINPELKKRFGMFFGLEFAGIGIDKGAENVAKLLNVSVGGNISMGVAISNYTGVSGTLGLGSNLGLRNDWMSAGVNMGATFSTDQGVDLDASVYGGVSSSKSAQGLTSAVNGSFGKGFNSREGLKYTSFGVNPSLSFGQKSASAAIASKLASYMPMGVNNTMVPISMQNFVPVITNVAFTESQFFQLKVGIESGASVYPNFGGSYGKDETRFQKDGSRKAYGYLNLENAAQEDITDFSRDRDGRFNRNMQYLPPGNMSYDIYAVNGQGTGGNFRAMRTDAGSVYDPYTTSENKATNNLVEIGAGNIFEAGWDKVNSFTTSTSGPWKIRKKPFSTRKTGSLHEPVFFKQAGEPSEASGDYLKAIGGTAPLLRKDIDWVNPSPLEQGTPDSNARARRSNLLYSFKAAEASDPNVSYESTLRSYDSSGKLSYTSIPRVGGNRRATQESEFTQLLPDGRRYIYGVPAMNNRQVEYVTSLPGGTSSNSNMIDVSGSKAYNATAPDPVFGQTFLMKTATPSYAHSYLLSSILSPDYSDLTGDGLSDDDIGTYTKFNYSRKESDYQWRTPYESTKGQYNEGVASDCHDDKATFVIGSKEIWMLHSIETKNYIAFFHTSPRLDGRASVDNILPVLGTQGKSYKLDSIVLYNRQEFLANKVTNTPTTSVKTVVFTYDYSLCKGLPVPNVADTSTGKLTLRAITIKSGGSDIGYLSPYRFTYGENPNYSNDAKDMWGSYKPAGANGALALGNHKFPYVIQDSAQATINASAWNLTDIRLPSGGAIHVDYEADDYAFVQDRRAMEMFKLAGIGPDDRFVAGNSLYQSQTSPYLYLYFQRKKRNGQYDELYPQLLKAYLDNNKLLQYNVRVRISAQGERTESCANELADYVKGYASVESMGVCSDNLDYGYIKLSPKTVDKMPSLGKLPGADISLNPIMLSAIFYARYYNNKALYPGSEIVSQNNTGALLKQLISSFGDLSDYIRSPLAKYINQGKAKVVDLSQSYVRLCSQGKKFGGGHRVKRIKFSDNWDAVSASGQPVATYGSEYNYTIDDGNGRMISSGVASYEPLLGGDENPFKEPLVTEQIGQKRDFPVVLPTELITEGPIGETMYPSASVGYRKVTITSIHKAEGASSQTIQEKEFYTAKDFPVRVSNTELEKLEDREPKAFDFSLNKREIFRAVQGYSLVFNDMHGKPSHERVLVQSGDAKPAEVSYKHYEYFTNSDGTLNNNVACLTARQGGTFTPVMKTLGVETDIMTDSREKIERTSTTGFMANLNIFMGPAVPIPIPTAFPKLPKSNTKTFSSVVSTKVVQQYGILKSVETFDKGAKVKLSNEVFDGNTGQPIVTKVNTEHNDYEYQIKAPAYWAYKNMGAGYQNILYEEAIDNSAATIAGDTLYFHSNGANRFQPGDELLLTVNEACGFGTITDPLTYKLWVVAKPEYVPRSFSAPQCVCDSLTGMSISYSAYHNCSDGLHTKSYAKYPAMYIGGKTADNVCGEPLSFVVRDTSEGWLTLHDLIETGGGGGNPQIPQLHGMLFGSERYPMESMTFDYDGGDYPTPNDPKGPYNLLGDYGPLAGDTMRIWWQDLRGPWEHTAWTKGQFASYKGHVDNAAQYNSEFPNRPLITKSNKLLKVTVNVAAKRVAYLTDGNYGNQQYFMTIGDFHGSQPTGHQWRCKYTFYFPYDKAVLKNITPQEIAALNKPETYWYGEWRTVNAKVWNPAWDPSVVTSPERVPLFSRLNPSAVSGYQHVQDYTTWYYWSDAEVITRSSIEGRDMNSSIVAAIPRKRNAVPRYGVSGPEFPNDGTVSKGAVKVIRSGFRNQLNEEIDQRSMVGTSGIANYGYRDSALAPLVGIQNIITAAASTYTDVAAGNEAVAYDGTDYYNPYVNGMNGNPKILSKYNIRDSRGYGAPTDPGRGLLSNVFTFWERVKNGDATYNCLRPGTAGTWTQDVTVKTYSPFGNDLEVEDAAGNLQSMLYGYGNSLPVASVKNSNWNNALYENFEDKGFPLPYVTLHQNELRRHVLTGGANVSVVSTAHHTGNFALRALDSVAIQMKIQANVPASYPPRALHPFYFRPGRKYVLSYWQAAAQDTANLTAPGIVAVTINGTTQYVYPKSPVIDGWVLYEGEIQIPKLPAGFKSGQATLALSKGTIDDIRILPIESNMKCYVYNPVNRKLAASLDENHMASFFEYDAEGKLIRVKKETERGILTLKESRSSVHGIITGDGTKSLTE